MIEFLFFVLYGLIGLLSFGIAFCEFTLDVDSYLKLLISLLISIAAGVFWPFIVLYIFVPSFLKYWRNK